MASNRRERSRHQVFPELGARSAHDYNHGILAPIHVNTTVRSSAFDVRFTGDAANAKAAVRPHRGQGPPLSLLSGSDSEPRPPPTDEHRAPLRATVNGH